MEVEDAQCAVVRGCDQVARGRVEGEAVDGQSVIGGEAYGGDDGGVGGGVHGELRRATGECGELMVGWRQREGDELVVRLRLYGAHDVSGSEVEQCDVAAIGAGDERRDRRGRGGGVRGELLLLPRAVELGVAVRVAAGVVAHHLPTLAGHARTRHGGGAPEEEDKREGSVHAGLGLKRQRHDCSAQMRSSNDRGADGYERRQGGEEGGRAWTDSTEP